MIEHLEIMKDKHKELEDRIVALNKFIHSDPAFKSLCDLEQARVIGLYGVLSQSLRLHNIMLAGSGIMNDRRKGYQRPAAVEVGVKILAVVIVVSVVWVMSK